MSALRALAPLCVVAVLLTGCSEEPQVTRHEAGEYDGKADTRPWESAAYDGDKARWESDMRARIGHQNELRRMPAD